MLFVIIVAVFGLVFGSFMNVLVYRVPRGLSIISPGSACTSCGCAIRWYDNIPVFSWLLLKGCCRHCGKRISFFYPLVEISVSIIYIALYIKFGFTEAFFKYIILGSVLLVAAFTDIETVLDEKFETGVIPVIYPVCGVLAGLCFGFYEGRFENALAGWAAGFLVLFIPAYIYSIIRGNEGMGEGDFTLLAMIGVFTGPASIPAILTISAVLGIAVGVVAVVITGNKKYPIPFAPMLAFGGLAYVFFEDVLKFSF